MISGRQTSWTRKLVRAFERVAAEAVKCGASDWWATTYVNGVRSSFGLRLGSDEHVAITQERYELLLSMVQASSPELSLAAAEFEGHFALAEAEWRLGGEASR